MDGESNNHRELRVWHRAMDLVVDCCQLTRSFPDTERYGLTTQIQRAAVSVPSNIAEGRSRGSKKAFASFLWIANGSLAELDTQIEASQRLGFVRDQPARKLLDEIQVVGRMITKLRQSLGD